ncbi:MAG: hypothetical protein HYY10_03710 [Candidatus Liptonbacteria bacterium]|nr:hypothetical protein [Candidatus Liptonbacteria bacterium]
MKRLYLFRDEGKWALQHLKLGRAAKEAWDRFVVNLYEIYSQAFRGKASLEIVSHRLEDIERGIMEKAGGCPTISMDPCIKGDINLGVSRIFAPGGNVELGIHERPGFLPLEQQIRRIPAGEYILIEDDVFSGGTIQEFVHLMRSVSDKIVIKKLIVGMQVGEPRVGVPVEALHSYTSEEVVDLNDPRDFLAGSYGGGLVIHYPRTTSHDYPEECRAPYVLPFVDTFARSSVPRERVLEFSRKIWECSLEFWRGFPEVKVGDADKCFAAMAVKWGFDWETAMYSFCEHMRDLLLIPPATNFKCLGKGVIWIDLNGTLITEDAGLLAADEGELRAVVAEAKARGWQIGLCSDSPAELLMLWGAKYGIDGPTIAENGALLFSSQELRPMEGCVLREGVDAAMTRRIVQEWAQAHSVCVLPDVVSPEFQEPHDRTNRADTGIGFGAGRIASVSMFCVKKGVPDGELAAKVAAHVERVQPNISVDSSPEHGFIAVHAVSLSSGKGRALRRIGWELYKEGKECWMIGNSRSDLTYAPALCRVGLVQLLGNVPAERIAAASSCTQGTIELIRAIIGI